MTAPQTGEPPIACTLMGSDYKQRLAWIADLNRDALREQRRNDLRLELTYTPEAAARVRKMVKREQECCAFLTFKLREDADATRLSIVAPEAAREDADLLFKPFQSTNETAAACGCSGGFQESAVTSRRANGPAVGIAATAAGGALVCAACCVLPFALPAVMLTAAGSVVVWLAGVAGWVAWLALLAVAGGWAWVWLQSARSKLRPARSTLYTMSIATVFLALAFGWPMVEQRVLDLIMT